MLAFHPTYGYWNYNLLAAFRELNYFPINSQNAYFGVGIRSFLG
jgi:hypothetical protein